MRALRVLGGLTLCGVLLGGCDGPGEWTGFVYRDAEYSETYVALTGLKSFEQCQEASIAQLRRLPKPDAGAYECSRACQWDATLQTNRCAEKRR